MSSTSQRPKPPRPVAKAAEPEIVQEASSPVSQPEPEPVSESPVVESEVIEETATAILERLPETKNESLANVDTQNMQEAKKLHSDVVAFTHRLAGAFSALGVLAGRGAIGADTLTKLGLSLGDLSALDALLSRDIDEMWLTSLNSVD